MKKIVTLAALIPAFAFGQGLVDSNPQNVKVLIEEFTGVNCGYCPDGHAIAQTITSNNSGNAVTVNIHAGSYAVPSAGQIDFRTPDGDAINGFFGITAYPSGVVNRTPYGGSLALGRSSWPPAADAALLLSSPVNLGMQSIFNSNTRDLAVDVEIHYTAAGTGGNDYISVYLLESNIIGYQADYTNGAHQNYSHNHAFRGAITPDVWGDEILISTAGHNETRQYSFNVPTAFDISNCHVVAFIGEHQGQVYQAREVIADGGTTLIVGSLELSTGSSYAEGTPGSITNFTPDFQNTLGTPEDFVFTLSSTNAPANWNSSFTINGNQYSGQTTLNLASGNTFSVDVDITPGSTVGVADYILTATSAANPTAPVLFQEFHIISGVTDLVLDNPGAELYGSLYDDGLAFASQAGAGRTAVSTAVDFAAAGALSNVVNVYYNVSWTFPAFSDDVVAELQSLMDNGVNLLIAGQDIGWDVMSGDPNANGTPAGQSFYENYLLADFDNDGGSGNSEINFSASDPVYAWTPNTTINSVFGTNSYPEEISPRAGAASIFTYNSPNKTGGVRGETSNFKVVYLGVGIEQVGDAAVASEIIKRAHDWFYGAVSTAEFDAGFAELMGQAYPVPADNQLIVPLNSLDQNAVLRITDATGKLIRSENVRKASQNVSLNTSDLSSGVYTYQLISADGTISEARLFEIKH